MKEKLLTGLRTLFSIRTWGTVILMMVYFLVLVCFAAILGSIWIVLVSVPQAYATTGSIILTGWFIIGGIKLIFDTIDHGEKFARVSIDTILALFKKTNDRSK